MKLKNIILNLLAAGVIIAITGFFFVSKSEALESDAECTVGLSLTSVTHGAGSYNATVTFFLSSTNSFTSTAEIESSDGAVVYSGTAIRTNNTKNLTGLAYGVNYSARGLATTSGVGQNDWNCPSALHVAAPATPIYMSGTLMPTSSSCTIAAGQSRCTKTLTWTTTNPVGTSAVTNGGSATPASVSGNNGSQLFTIPYNPNPDPYTGMPGTTNFYLYNNSVLLAQADVTTICASGTAWNGTYCSSNPVLPTGSISATNCTIANGQGSCNSSVTWDTQNRIPGANTAVTANNNSRTVFTAVSGTNQTAPVNFGTTDFYLYHNSLRLAEDFITASCVSGTNWNGTICTSNPIDGYWVGQWGGCDKNGMQTMTYSCVEPVNGGTECSMPPPPDETRNCPTGPLPVDGTCSLPPSHYVCATGTSANNKSSPSRWTWNCNGTNGGSNSPQCVEKRSSIFIEN